MADMTLDEALAAATEDVADDTLVIDNDLRTITIPDSVKLIGVESDGDVNILYFKMPKVYRGFDLSEFGIRINYTNRKKVNGAYVADTYMADMYAVNDAVVDGDYIRFSWLVGRNAAKYMGDTKFIVCLKKTDTEGNVVKEFNTTLAVLPVLEGLETTEQIVQENQDIIRQLLNEMDTMKGIATPEAMQGYVDTYFTTNPPSGMTKEERAQMEQNSQAVTELKSDLSQKVNISQGEENAGKFLGIDGEGHVIPVSAPTGGSSATTGDMLLAYLPYTPTEQNCYLLSDTDTTIQVGSDEDDLYARDGEYLVGDATNVIWCEDSVSYVSGSNQFGLYTHLTNFTPGKTYTLFAKSKNKGSIRVLVKENDTNIFLGTSIAQLNITDNDTDSFITFTVSSDTKWLNLGFGAASATSGISAEFYDLALYEGTYTRRPIASSFDAVAGEKYNTDAFIGMRLSSSVTVAVYKKNTNSAENDNDTDGVIFFGDSILDFSDVVSRYAEATGKSCLDCAVGGTRFDGARDNTNEYYPYDMTNIADAIASGDFSAQINGGKNSQFSILASGNISAYKAMVLEFGANDFSADIPFEGSDVMSVEGSLRHIFDLILTSYPTMRIIVLSTKQFVTQGVGSETHSHPDGTVWEMNLIIKGICDEYGIPWIDMYHALGENALTRSSLTSDGVHLSGFGSLRYADIMRGKLNALGV